MESELPSIADFANDGVDPAHYARLADDWALAVADIVGSTKLAAAGRDKDVNFVAGGAVAVLGEAARRGDEAVACQFGGDGAIAAVPPDRLDATRAALAALAHWAASEFQIDLRVGLVPVAALRAKNLDAFVALRDFGNRNTFGLFLGDGIVAADSWVKHDAQWRIAPAAGELVGLEGLSCRWQPVASRNGTVLCVIADPVAAGSAGIASLGRVLRAIDACANGMDTAPLGDGTPLLPRFMPSLAALSREARAAVPGKRAARVATAMLGALIAYVVHLCGGRVGAIDIRRYRHDMAERSDHRKAAGGPRLVLDVSEDAATRIEAVLAAAEAAGEIRYGTARADATTVTCLVGDFAADRHVHFVDGAGLGFWRASEMLKAKKPTGV
jgi:hypothetical protein